MEDSAQVEYTFRKRGLTICQHSLSEGDEPVTVFVENGDHEVAVRLSFAPATDPETGVMSSYPLMNGQQVFCNMPTMVEGPKVYETDTYGNKQDKYFEGLTVVARVVVTALAQREPRADGLKCGDCDLWNREAGVEELEKVTHQFQNGVGKMVREICDTMATTHGKAMLTPKNVGYCPKLQSLCGDKAPGCEHLVEK